MDESDLIIRYEQVLGKTLFYNRRSRQLSLVTHETPHRQTRNKITHNPGYDDILSAPLKVFMSITRACDLSCPMCFAKNKSSDQPVLKSYELNNIIDNLSRMGVFEIRLTGGEPTVHPEFYNIVKWINNAGMNISINTHGAYSSDKLERMIECGVHDYHISIDGPENVHDSLRGKGSFKRSIYSIEQLKSAGKRVRINTTIFRGNLHLLEDIVRLAENLQVNIKLSPMRAIGSKESVEFSQRNALLPPQWQKIKEKLAGLALQTRVTVSFFSNEEIENFNLCDGRNDLIENAHCGSWFTQIGIDPEGDVYAGGCIDDIPKRLSVGSIRNSSIMDLWLNAARYVNNRLLKRFDKCNQCNSGLLWNEWSRRLSQQTTQSEHLY